MTLHTYSLEEQFLTQKWVLLESSSRHIVQNTTEKNKILLETFQLQFKCGPYRNVQISFSKLPIIPQEHRLVYSQSKQASRINF